MKLNSKMSNIFWLIFKKLEEMYFLLEILFKIKKIKSFLN